MFQSLVMTGLTPLCNTNEISDWDNRPFSGKWPDNQHSLRGTEVTKTIKKKPKRIRTTYTTEQLQTLEEIFAASKYIDAQQRKKLSVTLNIREKALKIWFQNRRMKVKKESSESSDTSSEITSCQSPLKENCQLNDVIAAVPISNYYDSSEPPHYQFPNCYYSEAIPGDGYQNGYYHLQNSAGFGVDANVYPSEYYPALNEQCSGDMQAYGPAQYNYGEYDGWYAKSFDLNYFS